MATKKMIFIIFTSFLLCVSSVFGAGEFIKMPSAGGQCDYKKYKGHAKIISITQKSEAHNHSHETYKVTFTFTADQEVKEEFAQTEGMKFVLLLNNSAYPGPQFLKKYDINVASIFDCYMKVIVRGTCTPVLFEFPTIRLDDYFEN